MTLPNFPLIKTVAVLGSGVMGAQIAAVFANFNIPVRLYDLPANMPNKNAMIDDALKHLLKLQPSPVFSPDVITQIQACNYDEHLPLLSECDLIIEAISEREDWKLALYKKITPFIKKNTLLATNTSGIPLERLKEGFPKDLQSQFLGMHFFNPPRYMHLVELVPHSTTLPEALDSAETFLTRALGKGVIRAKDTPNFIANRIGVFAMLAALKHAETYQLQLDCVDALTGTLIGRPKSATFRTMDVVGLDTLAHVVNTFKEALKDDPWYAYFELPDYIKNLIAKGSLGQKTGAGIYKKEGKEILVLDPVREEYHLSHPKVDSEVLALMQAKTPFDLLALQKSSKKEAQFLWACFRDLFHYAAFHAENIAHTVRDIDLSLRFGFGWGMGPFEQWQQTGWAAIAKAIAHDIEAGKALSKVPLPAWVQNEAVYTTQGAYSPQSKTYVARRVSHRQLFPAATAGEVFDEGKTIFENEFARLFTHNDGVAVLSFKSKMNTVSGGVLASIVESVAIAEKEYKALVLWQRQGDNFSVGANLKEFVDILAKKDDALVMEAARRFQEGALALRRSHVPTVAAVKGFVFGGAVEIMMHCTRAVAHSESYIGLVEGGVGILPAGAGSKEMALRAQQMALGTDKWPLMQQFFKQIAMADVSKSAAEAKQKGYLRDADIIVPNVHELLYVAKTQALALAESGYRPPLPTMIEALGRPAMATINTLLINMREGNFISDHDYLIASHMATVLCGGDVDAGTLCTEEWYLALEREHFAALAKTEKTQLRIKQMLVTGKPLRN